MRRYLVLTTLIATIFIAGCASSYFIAPGFTGENLNSGGLAIFPVLIGQGTVSPGVETYRRSCGEGLAIGIREKLPSLKVIAPSQVSNTLSEKDLVDDYAKLSENFKQTGVFDALTAGKMAKVVGAQYFMIVRISGLYSPKEKHALALLNGQIYDSERAEMVFETNVKYEDISIFGGPNYGRAMENATKKISASVAQIYKTK